jgi:exopolysaccharide biosynthesis polyprenyl glycosylphosphotransferase
MLKEREKLFYELSKTLDVVVVGAAFLLSYSLRDGFHYLDFAALDLLHKMRPLKDYAWIMMLAIPLWIVFLSKVGAYQSMRQKKFGAIFWIVFDASLFSVIVFSAIAFVLKLEFLSRMFVLIFFTCSVLLLFIEKIITLSLLRSLRRRGYNYRVLLVAGSGRRAKNFADLIHSHPHWGLKILGFIDEEERVGMRIGNNEVIGSFDEFASILDGNVVDEVVFILPRKMLDRLKDSIMLCEEVGVKATIAADFFDTKIAQPVLKELHGLPFLTFDTMPYKFRHLALKRLFDLSISSLGFILLSPFFLAVAVIIKATSEGPVFFKQKRCGLNGRIFTICKFRTMVVDAEKRLQELAEFNEREGPVFKMKNDPRVTWIGRFLRKTSLDELPQLINVFKGDMSLIGPRPSIPSEVERYERWQRRRLSLRPGIACIHEVVARDDADFERWMRMDLEYIDNWSLELDARILASSILTVFRGTGV